MAAETVASTSCPTAQSLSVSDNIASSIWSETVMVCSTQHAMIFDGTLPSLHSSLFRRRKRPFKKNQMHFRQCGVSVPITCYSAVALQLRHQCLCTAPSHVAAAEMPSRPLCDSGCSGSAGGRKCPRLALAPSWQRLAGCEHSPGSPQSNM